MTDAIPKRPPKPPPPPPPPSSSSISSDRPSQPAPPPKPPREKSQDRNAAPIEDSIKPFLENANNSDFPVEVRDRNDTETERTRKQPPIQGAFNFSNPMIGKSEKKNQGVGSSKGSESPYTSIPGTVSDGDSSRNSPSKLPTVNRAPAQKPKRVLGPADTHNQIYHLVVFSELWFIIFLVLHIGQFTILYSASYESLPTPAFIVLLILTLAVTVLVVSSRFLVKKSRLSLQRNLRLKGGTCSPEDEADEVSDLSVYFVTIACILQGIIYAIYSAVLVGRHVHVSQSGYYTQSTILETLRFSSIVLLALHRIFRPSNRADPMRTILEV